MMLCKAGPVSFQRSESTGKGPNQDGDGEGKRKLQASGEFGKVYLHWRARTDNWKDAADLRHAGKGGSCG